MKDLKIDEEFQKLIPPMQQDEFDGLKASVIKEGCRDALVVWAETGILVDGHNRYRICKENQIGFSIHKKSFEDRDSVLLWIIDNQCCRRNLQPIDKVPMAEKKRGILARMARENQAVYYGNQYESGLMTKSTEVQPVLTRDVLGKTIGASGTTYDALVKTINNGVPELVEAVRNKKVGSENAARIATLPEEEQRAVVKQGERAMRAKAKEIKHPGRKIMMAEEPKTKKDYPHSDANHFVDLARFQLERIRFDDPLRLPALERLEAWIANFKEKRK